MVDVKPLWLDQHPMDSGDFNLVSRGSFTNPVPLGGRNLGNRISQGERRDLHTAIPQFRGKRQNNPHLSIPANFLAKCKIYFIWIFASYLNSRLFLTLRH